MNAVGAGAGLLMGLGLLAGASWWRDRRPLPLLDRIGPFVGAGRRATPVRGAGWTFTAVAARVRGMRVANHVEGDRLRSLRWAVIGAGLALAICLVAGGGASPLAVALVVAAGASAGWWAVAQLDKVQSRRQRRAMLIQLPMLADLVSLAVSAGCSPIVALDVAAQAHPGPLSDEVLRAASDCRSGIAPHTALGSLVDRVRLSEVRRFVEALQLATDLGTPVGEVARAQAVDIRSTARRRWSEQAARRDVAMLVPIVFLVLPSVVVVAMYPGLESLRLVVP